MKKCLISIPCILLLGMVLFAEPVYARTQVYRSDRPDYSEFGNEGWVLETLYDSFIAPVKDTFDGMNSHVRALINSVFSVDDFIGYLEKTPEAAKSSSSRVQFLQSVGNNEIGKAIKSGIADFLSDCTGYDFGAGRQALKIVKPNYEYKGFGKNEEKKKYDEREMSGISFGGFKGENTDTSKKEQSKPQGFTNFDDDKDTIKELVLTDHTGKDSNVKIRDASDSFLYFTNHGSFDEYVVFETYQGNTYDREPYIKYDVSPFSEFQGILVTKNNNRDDNEFHMEFYLDDQLIEETETFDKNTDYIPIMLNISNGKELKIVCVREDHNFNASENDVTASVAIVHGKFFE